MELLYIYLDDYKNFKKNGICFTSEFIITTTVTENEINLHIKLNPDFIPNFFDNNEILNVSAIIGQNGTGKSNILEFIRTALPDGMGGFIYECIIGLKGPNTYKIFYTPLIKVNMEDETDKFQIIPLPKRKKEKFFFSNYSIDLFSDTVFVNYSNIVDLKIPNSLTKSKLESEEESTSATGYRNISTMALLLKDQQDFSYDQRIKIDKIDAYKSREFGRNIEFITSSFKYLMEFDLPEYLFITLMEEDERSLQSQLPKVEWVFEAVNKYNNEFLDRNTPPKALFYLHFLRSVFYNIIRTDLSSTQINFSPDYITKTQGKNFEDFFRNMLENMKSATFEGLSTSDLKEKADLILQFIDFMYEYLIKTPEPGLIMESERVLALPVNFEGKFPIQQFIDLYVKTKNLTDFLLFKWRSLSSGEQSMMTLISRFYSLHKDLKDEKGIQNMIILLDEPDIYFHPEWQRNLLSNLLDYIPKLFKFKRIQFIITANTPYLVSDLPPSNVLLLRKKKKGLQIDTASSLAKATFASNIHTLLSEDFYVSNFVGEFAKRKIESLVEFIINPSIENARYTPEIAKKMIGLIGEPIIRSRLQDMYVEKFESESGELQQRKKRLEIELEELNNLIKEEGDNA